jgi:flagellar operon protein (TIGR03826 family)
MNVKNCVKCGKIFNYLSGRPICPACVKNLEEEFKTVRTYVKRNPNASIAEVAEVNEVDIKQIKQWIREEKLSFSKDSGVGIDCEVCGVTIKTGRFCDTCKKTVTNDLNNAYDRPKKVEENPFANQKKETKMRFMNKDR